MTNDPTQPSGDDSTASLDGLGDDQDIILDSEETNAGDGVKDDSAADGIAAGGDADTVEADSADDADAESDDVESDDAESDDADSVDDAESDAESVGDTVAGGKAPRGTAVEDDEPDDDEPGVLVAESDDIPEELREDTSEPGSEPATGLVSDIRDLTFGQAAGLVANREMASIGRGPLFVASTLLVIVGVIAAILFGATQKDDAAGTPVLAAVGIGDPAQIEQGYGVSVIEAKDAAEAESLVRQGKADAAILPDTSGQSQMGVQIIALNSEPTAVIDKLMPPPPILYLQQRPVSEPVGTGTGWGMGLLMVLSVLALGYGLFSNLQLERRNRIGELLASAVPAKANAWGKIVGVTTLALVQAALAVGILMLGMSVAGNQEVLGAMIPALGYFFGLVVFVFAVFMGLYLGVSSIAGARARKIGYGGVTGLALVSALAPVFLANVPSALLWLSYIPLSSPVAMPIRLLQQQLPFWQPLLALGIAIVTALLVYAFGSGAYASNLLRGTGRGGRSATAKSEKKALKAAKDDAEKRADDDDDDDAAASESKSTRAAAARPKKSKDGAAATSAASSKSTASSKAGVSSKTAASSGAGATSKSSASAKSTASKRRAAASKSTAPVDEDGDASTAVGRSRGSEAASKDAETGGEATPSAKSPVRASSQQRKTPPATKSRRRRKR